MYHEITDKQRRQRRITTLLVGLCVLLVAALIALVIAIAQFDGREQAAHSIRQSVLNTAMQCAAVEGAYPSSLQYLEDYYGLRINHDDYIVQYEVFAGNVVPSVVVMPR